MRNVIDINKHRLVADGGESIDKRTWAAKDLVKRIKEVALYDGDDINPNFLGLRMKDINNLYTIDNLNLN